MTDRIALVDAEGVVQLIDRRGELALFNDAAFGQIIRKHINAGGTVQRVPASVQVGDRWPGVCAWTCDADGFWDSACGAVWQLPEGVDEPSEAGFTFCPHCGNPVEQEDGCAG